MQSEYELEVMRDLNDNVVIICSIENIDPMGIHTGDSITVAPAQTLSDKEYQSMRDAAIKIIREIGVETGGSNIQFALNPQDGRMIVIEMNPRVSRSSALASKATGFPIAKIAAKLAIGYTLDEIPNDITRETPASFEPTIDYVVVKYPRWTFEKFAQANKILTTQMKSVGEAMAIGRTFKEALQKVIRSMETKKLSLTGCGNNVHTDNKDDLKENLIKPNSERIFYIYRAYHRGMRTDEIQQLTKIDPWFLSQLKEIYELEKELSAYEVKSIPSEMIYKAKVYGFSDQALAQILLTDTETIRKIRKDKKILPTYKMVDTCAAEFETVTPYYYSTYESEDEVVFSNRKKVMILGSGPNRIGQGIEFDYACVHAVFALREENFETIMVNSNPETVSTDYDTADRLYFEPLTVEDVLNIYEKENPLGIIVQFGGQTPLNLAKELEKNGVKILGTSPESIDIAEDRERFKFMLEKLNIPQPESGTARSFEDALKIARKIDYPLMVRPSYVLGGRAMEIVHDKDSLENYVCHAIEVSPQHPILIDKFLDRAIEIDVDALCDGEKVFIGGIMEHIEEAGVHSGDSACVLPPYSLNEKIITIIKNYTCLLAKELNVIGLINIQYAFLNDTVYVLEVNPRASRTVPFVSKATGVPLAKMAAKIIVGKKLADLGLSAEIKLNYVAVKEAVFPFSKFPEVDPVLGPEMKATGEVMGIASSFGLAFYKAEEAALMKLPVEGTILISLADRDKDHISKLTDRIAKLGFKILATQGTKELFENKGLPCELAFKLHETRPNIIDNILNKQIHMIINTPDGKKGKHEDSYIRKAAIRHNIPYITTLSAAMAAMEGIEKAKHGNIKVKSIQEYNKMLRSSAE